MDNYAIIKDASQGKFYLMRESEVEINGIKPLIQPVDISSEKLILKKIRGVESPVKIPDNMELTALIDEIKENAVPTENKRHLIVSIRHSNPEGVVSVTPIILNREKRILADKTAEKISAVELNLAQTVRLTEGTGEFYKYSPTSTNGRVGDGWSSTYNCWYKYKTAVYFPMPDKITVKNSILRLYPYDEEFKKLASVKIKFFKEGVEDPNVFSGSEFWDDSLFTESIEIDCLDWPDNQNSSFKTSVYLPGFDDLLNEVLNSDGFNTGDYLGVLIEPGERTNDGELSESWYFSTYKVDAPYLDNILSPFFTLDYTKITYDEFLSILETKSTGMGVSKFAVDGKYVSPTIGWDIFGGEKSMIHITGLSADNEIECFAGSKN